MLKRRLTSIVSVLIVVLMLVSVTACGTKDNTGSTTTSTATTGEKLSGALVSKDKITLKMLTTEWSGLIVGNDMAVYKELEKRTNVHLEFTLLPLTNPAQNEKFNLIMASGDLPDLIGFGTADLIVKYGVEGALIPLQDLIKKNAPDIVKALDNPLSTDKLPYKMNNWAEITAADGNIYNVPLISSSNAIGAVFAMRTDWLDNLKMKVPTTSTELYDVLKAFKEKDPNGNQKQDEIPFVAAAGGKTPTILPVINAFDAHMGFYVDTKDNKIKYGPVEANYKTAMTYLNKLYKEGLIEQDYLTATRDQWLARTTSNTAGLMFAWPASGIGGATSGLQKLDPKFKFEAIAPFKSPSGKQFKDTQTAGRYLAYRSSITKSNKYPVETMKYLNYCFTPEGTTLVSYGVEGTHYTVVNGKPQYTDLIMKNPKGLDIETARVAEGVDWTALPYQIGWESQFAAMEKSAPWTTKAWEVYREPGMVESPFPTLKYTDAEFAKRNNLQAELDTLVTPMIDKFIMGGESVDKFDAFVASVNKAGLEDLLKIMNDAYGRYQKFTK